MIWIKNIKDVKGNKITNNLKNSFGHLEFCRLGPTTLKLHLPSFKDVAEIIAYLTFGIAAVVSFHNI